MHSRALRIFLLALIALWYGAVLPGHQRGVVQMPGAAGDGCCEHDQPHDERDPADVPASPRSCAVCFYMAALDQAAPPDLGITPLGLTSRQPAAAAPAPATVRVHPTYLGRAPPLA